MKQTVRVGTRVFKVFPIFGRREGVVTELLFSEDTRDNPWIIIEWAPHDRSSAVWAVHAAEGVKLL
jgi:hypothetical protein